MNTTDTFAIYQVNDMFYQDRYEVICNIANLMGLTTEIKTVDGFMTKEHTVRVTGNVDVLQKFDKHVQSNKLIDTVIIFENTKETGTD